MEIAVRTRVYTGKCCKEAGFQEGMRISAKGVNGRIVIQIDDKGPINFPRKNGKGNPRYAFEAATTTLGLKEMVRTKLRPKSS